MVARGSFRCKDRSEPRSSMGVLLAEGMGINFVDCSFPHKGQGSFVGWKVMA